MCEIDMNFRTLSVLSLFCVIMCVNCHHMFRPPFPRRSLRNSILWRSMASPFNTRFFMPRQRFNYPTIDEEIMAERGGDMFNFPLETTETGERRYILEGDIRVNEAEYILYQNMPEEPQHAPGSLIRKKRKTVGDSGRLWRGGEILIAIDTRAAFTQEDRLAVQEALAEWSAKTCIRFRSPNRNDIIMQRPFVLLQDGNGCSSAIGQSATQTSGRYRYQPIILAKGCRKRHIIVHEVGHVIGLIHEQSRTERDNYINIVWSNVNPSMYHNFRKFPAQLTDSRNTPYDYTSIMHYGPRAFSSNDEPTMQTVDPAYQNIIGSVEELSQLDALAVNRMYNCPNVIGKKKK